MRDMTPQERLQPALLDRLTDDDPEKTSEPRESRLITTSRLREAVLRDLAWLLNAARPGDDEGLAQYDEARRSVLNFGMPPLAGATASTLDLQALEQAIRQAILDYEPRISPASLRVESILSDSVLDQHNVVSIQISGELWAQPVPLELLLRTDVDLESGEVRIQELKSER
jgi:type VI secretion system protein ImpF